MDAVTMFPSTKDGASMQPPTPRKKTKRPQLSCNGCRLRKVKCDRLQPCTKCSLHQTAELCHYDLTDTERQPILQAEALKEKDKEINRLRDQIHYLGGQLSKPESSSNGRSSRYSSRPDIPSRVTKKPPSPRRRRFNRRKLADSIYFGAPGLSDVIEEFTRLAVEPRISSLTHSAIRGTDHFAFQMAAPHPFPTLWSAKDGTLSLFQLLPNEQEIDSYLKAFQRRAQSSSFPHVPEECTKLEVQRFLENAEHNSAVHPDMLALLFTTLALGLQLGVYDKCGEDWKHGAVEAESKQGDVYIAAAMQALRLASFMSRPTLLVIQTLLMIGPYLTNSGKFLDAWALFSLTIRLAQGIGLHRDPRRLNPPPPDKEVMVRKNLWWWMLHMDAHYSLTIGRPLGISSIGDCPAPETLTPGRTNQSLSSYICHFSILARQILSAGYLGNAQIDEFTGRLLALMDTLPETLRFDETWRAKEKPLPKWPLDAQAAVLHCNTHNLLILLNRQRLDDQRQVFGDSASESSSQYPDQDIGIISRGRDRVLQSCRSLLMVFEFINTRVKALMICWTIGQQAFNAANILLLSLLETRDSEDLRVVELAYHTFHFMHLRGIHKLAGPAFEKLGMLLKEQPASDSIKETVMGQEGMILLEDPGLQGFLPGRFSPLNFQMVGSAVQKYDVTTPWVSSSSGAVLGKSRVAKPTPASQPTRKRPQRKANSVDGLNPRISVKKPKLTTQSSLTSQNTLGHIIPAALTPQRHRIHGGRGIPRTSSISIPSAFTTSTLTTSPTHASHLDTTGNKNTSKPAPPNPFSQQSQPVHDSNFEVLPRRNTYTQPPTYTPHSVSPVSDQPNAYNQLIPPTLDNNLQAHQHIDNTLQPHQTIDSSPQDLIGYDPQKTPFAPYMPPGFANRQFQPFQMPSSNLMQYYEFGSPHP